MVDRYAALLTKQLNNMFEILNQEERNMIHEAVQNSYKKYTEHIQRLVVKGFERLNPYHSGQYCIFLYTISRQLYQEQNSMQLADRVYYLNKIMNGIDLYYQVELKSPYYFEHPVGTVLGKARYGEKFTVYQGCTVGGIHKGVSDFVYPDIGDNVMMFSHSSLIGACTVGNNVILASNTIVKNENIPDNVLVFGQSPTLVFKENNKNIQIYEV